MTLAGPSDVVLDASGHFYIADNRGNRIIRVTATGSQCLLGCSGGGSTAHQFNIAYSLRFDSHGNLFVADEFNRRIQKCSLIHNCQGQSPPSPSTDLHSSISVSAHSFHRPQLCSNATWNHTALTVASNTTLGDAATRGIFVDVDDTLYYADYQHDRILSWPC